MTNPKRGMTMIELCIYMFLFAIATGVVIALFTTTRQSSQHTVASYLVNGQTETAIRWLRRDLKETALASLQTYPNKDFSTQAPGVSMVSARTEKGSLLTNKHGAPQWDRHVFYTLDADPGARTGKLVRWERELDVKDLLPHLATLRPSQVQGNLRRVVLGNVLVPGVKPAGAVDTATGPSGGFRVEFVRRAGGDDGAETLTSVNPSQGNPQDNTKLVEAELQIYQENGAKPDYYAIKLRVSPAY